MSNAAQEDYRGHCLNQILNFFEFSATKNTLKCLFLVCQVHISTIELRIEMCFEVLESSKYSVFHIENVKILSVSRLYRCFHVELREISLKNKLNHPNPNHYVMNIK